jgi:CRISPR type IV-associated protein Csf3
MSSRLIMEPMRIRAYLLDGRIAGTESWFPLDSILAAEWIRRHHPDKFYTPPPPGVKDGWIEADLPFALRGSEGRWYYACSFNLTEPLTEYITYWHRRFDDVLERYIDFQGRRGKVDEKSGKYKAYRMPLNILLLPWLEWYAVGHIKSVQSLCEGIPALGKKPAQGYGIVERWEVVPWPEDWSEVRDGRLTRAVFELPAGVRGGRRRLYGMRPPYWRKQEEVWMPA